MLKKKKKKKNVFTLQLPLETFESEMGYGPPPPDHCTASQWNHVVHDELKIATDFLLARYKGSSRRKRKPGRWYRARARSLKIENRKSPWGMGWGDWWHEETGGIMEKLHLHWKEENEKKRRIGGRKTDVNLKEESLYKGYSPLNVPYV